MRTWGFLCIYCIKRLGEGRKRWLYPPLENCGQKELNMDKGQAHAILNQVKLGMYFSQGKINEALYITGDLDINQLTPKACRPLRIDGPESCYVRNREIESSGIGEGFSWSMDWNRKRSGIEN